MTDRDDDLSAYLDDALPKAERTALARDIAADPALERRLDMLRAADGLAAERMTTVLAEPVPAWMIGAITQFGEVPPVLEPSVRAPARRPLDSGPG